MKDHTGLKYHSLTAIEQAPKGDKYTDYNGVFWLCRCDCGGTTVLPAKYLGKVKTCGCGKSGKGAKKPWVAGNARTHGFSSTQIYNVWKSIIARCFNPNDETFASYGGRGITICEGWRGDVTAFAEDMGKRPSRKHSVDRIDNNLGYTCGRCAECVREGWSLNCQWATQREQCNNRRDNTVIEAFGRSQTLTQWSDETGINYQTIAGRIRKGWSPEKALGTPVKHKRNKPIYHDIDLRRQVAEQYQEGKSITALAKENGVSNPCIRRVLEDFDITTIRHHGASIDNTRFREVTARIVGMYVQGSSLAQIKKELHVTAESIKAVLEEAGVTLRSASEQCKLRPKGWNRPPKD